LQFDRHAVGIIAPVGVALVATPEQRRDELLVYMAAGAQA
jgi:hypothetical protein